MSKADEVPSRQGEIMRVAAEFFIERGQARSGSSV